MQNAQSKAEHDFSGPGISEDDLVSHAAQGNEDAFEALMRRYNQRLFRTARSILGNDADAEEALQDAYISIWQALAGFRADAQLSTWLVRVVMNQALGRLRRKRAHVIPLDTVMNSLDPEVQAVLTEKRDQQPEQLAMQTQLRKVLEMHIDRLPDLYRTVFVLRAVQEMTAPEVAVALQIPEATVRTRLARARGLLRASLATDIDLTLEDAFSFDGERCDRIVGAVLARIRNLRLLGQTHTDK
jgi:RNA polymerase sigma-70 factor (ECF subfamily)